MLRVVELSVDNAITTIKTKARNRLDVCSDIRLAASMTEPNMKGLLKQNQVQVAD